MAERLPNNEEFDDRHFIQVLIMMDLELNKAKRAIKAAMQNSDERELLKQMTNKKEITRRIIEFLAKAYIDTDGEVAYLPEFIMGGDRALQLSVPFEGAALWVEVGKMVERMEHGDLSEERKEIAADIEKVTKA